MLVEQTGLSDKSARHVLMTLVAEGYLTGHTEFSADHFTHEQIVDWSTITCSLCSIALTQSALRPGAAGLVSAQARAAEYASARGEAVFFTMVALVGSFFKASTNNRYLDLVADVVPPAFLRVVWLGDDEDRLRASLCFLVDRLAVGDEAAVYRANADFWQIAEAQAQRFLDVGASGANFSRRRKPCRQRDVNLAGQVRPFARSSLDVLLPPLAVQAATR